jgi:uracil-DNA glycosylase
VSSVQNEPAAGIMGRSFYCPFDVSEISLLLVSKNPGISDPRENRIYAPLTDRERVKAHEDFVRNRFLGTNTIITSRYHEHILQWIAIVLAVEPTHDAIFHRTAMTALVKCHSQQDKTKTLPKSTKNICSDAFLYSEINIIRPKFLIAVGDEAYKYLNQSDIQSRHKLPVERLHHPSWTNMPGGVDHYRRSELPRIRKEYLKAIAT